MGSDATRDLREAQLSDPGIALVLRAKERDCKPPQQWDQLEVHGGVLARKFEQEDKGVIYQWIVPPGRRKEILHQLHAWVHILVRPKLFESCESASNGLDMWRISRSGSARELCEQTKNPTQKKQAPLVSIHTGYPMQRVATDILGPLPETQAEPYSCEKASRLSFLSFLPT